MVIRITRDVFSMVPATELCQILMTVGSTGAMQERMVRYLWVGDVSVCQLFSV